MKQDIRIIRNILIFGFTAGLFYLIYLLQSIITPLILAFFLALIIFPLLKFLTDKGIPKAISLPLSVAIMISIFVVTIKTLQLSISELVDHKQELSALFHEKMQLLKIPIEGVKTKIEKLADPNKLFSHLTPVAKDLAAMLGTTVTVFIYLFIILGGILGYKKYFEKLEGGKDGKWLDLFEKNRSAFSVYIRVKFIASLGTGLCFALLCFFFGIDGAFFWGFLAFCLNFIPTFGSMMATIPTIIFGFLYLDLGALFVFSLLLLSVQLIFGNVLEPRYLDKKLSINALVILIGLVFWIKILGLTGAVLAVPLLVITKLILDSQESTKKFARFLGS